ncbi:MAG: DUF4280 domain-containing protein [Actinomycetota bacterium]|nr:DUF4280 domain-containing protein [Actinomycetota bacterium]
MPPIVVAGAQMMCSFGLVPSTLIAEGTVLADELPVATIANMIPIDNIPPFGMCDSLANPEVDAATTAALGVLTPMPCVPVIVDPWIPLAPTVQADGIPVLVMGSMCNCAWGGIVEIIEPGQVSVQVNA